MSANYRGALLAGALILLCHAVSAQEVAGSPWTVGGAVRFNYVYKSWQDDYPSGFVGLDTARLDVNFDDGTLIGSAQYRYNRYPKGQGGYWQHFLHHGWVGMRLADKSTVQAGLVKNPFGLQPFASNNFYESMAFYTGFEDKYDLGVTYASRPGPVEWQLGFFPRDGGSYGGGSNTAGASNRYSYNIVPDDDQQGYATGQRDRERMTFTGRVVAHIGSAGQHEVGLSALTGTIRNETGNETRSEGRDTRRNAVALHYRGGTGPWNVMLEALRYSYDIPGTLGPLGGFKLYNDYSILRKRVGNYKSSVQNVSGLTFSSGKWVFYADFMLGKHHPYLSPDGGGLASTSSVHDGYTRRINLQAGYYF
jgi:hypothetical protein